MTKIKEYSSMTAANKDMSKMESDGWEVMNVQHKSNGFSCLKVGCLGILFLPLALLGRKRDSVIVTYKK